MPEYATEYTLDDVLAWVNNVRQEHGIVPLKHLPWGWPGSPCECVIGKAIVGRAYDVSYIPAFEATVPEKRLLRNFPDYITEFVRDFDRGRWPMLYSEDYHATIGEDDEREAA